MNIRDSIIVVFFLMMAFSLSACKENTSAPVDSIEDVFPLATGDTWSYHLQNWTDSITKTVDTVFSALIQEAFIFQGHPAYYYSFGDPNNRRAVYYSGSDLFFGNNDGTSVLLIHYPMGVDEKLILFDTTHSDGIRQTAELIFRGSNEPIHTPAGNFSCYHYDEIHTISFQNKIDTVFLSNLYFAKKVGLVLEKDYENYTGNRFLSLFEELLTYKVQ